MISADKPEAASMTISDVVVVLPSNMPERGERTCDPAITMRANDDGDCSASSMMEVRLSAAFTSKSICGGGREGGEEGGGSGGGDGGGSAGGLPGGGIQASRIDHSGCPEAFHTSGACVDQLAWIVARLQASKLEASRKTFRKPVPGT